MNREMQYNPKAEERFNDLITIGFYVGVICAFVGAVDILWELLKLAKWAVGYF